MGYEVRNGSTDARGYSVAVKAVAFSPDNKVLASALVSVASYASTVKLWDVDSAVTLQTLEVDYVISFLSFSRDGKSFINGGRQLFPALLKNRLAISPTSRPCSLFVQNQ